MAIMIRSKKAAKIVKDILGIPPAGKKPKNDNKKAEEHREYNDASELR